MQSLWKRVFYILLVAVFSFAVIYYTVDLKPSTDLNEVSCDTYANNSEKVNCWLALIERDIDSGDTAKALSEVAQLSKGNDFFKRNCHDFMHTIGEKSFLRFNEGLPFTINEHVSLCTYGFYHGFIETLIHVTNDFDDAVDFCQYVNGVLADNAEINQDTLVQNCYHGIGHGTLDDHISDKSDPYVLTKQTLELCSRVTSETDKLQDCATGVFNGVANYYLDGSLSWELNRADPATLCGVQDSIFQNTCYAYMARVFLSINQDDLLASMHQIKSTVPSRHVSTTIRNMSLVWMVGQRDKSKATLSQALEHCHETDQLNHQVACVEGLVAGLIQSGATHLPEAQIYDLCLNKRLDGVTQNSCFMYGVEELQRWYSPLKVRDFCANLYNLHNRQCSKN